MKKNSGAYYVKIAEKNGLAIKSGKGSHVKVYGPNGRGYMVIPQHRELATGTSYAIRKWFKGLGILVVLIMPVACLLVAFLA